MVVRPGPRSVESRNRTSASPPLEKAAGWSEDELGPPLVGLLEPGKAGFREHGEIGIGIEETLQDPRLNHGLTTGPSRNRSACGTFG
jgi:hypothetical protein